LVSLLYVIMVCHVLLWKLVDALDNKKLQSLVEEISITFFHKPFIHQALFNPRLRSTGGRYLLASHNIEVNKKYFELFGEEELVGIIKHELCHYHLHLEGMGYRHRDHDFKSLLKKVDAPLFCTPLPDHKKRRTVQKIVTYICKDCSQIYKRKRAMNTSKYVCGKCRGKLFRV
jgi:SprT-like protein